MASWQSITAFGILLVVSDPIHVAVSLNEDPKHQNEPDENIGHRYLETDDQYVCMETPPEDVPIYDKLDENMIKAMFPEVDWVLQGLYRLTEEEKTANLAKDLANINEQNTAYKEKKSSFFSGPTPFSILGRPAEGSISRKKVVKVGKGQISQDLCNGKSNMSTDYLKKILEEGPPPLEFHTPKTKLTDVKNQGVCNACGFFAQIAAIETGILIQNSTLINSKVDLSEQALLDCFVEKKDDDGCGGVRKLSAIMVYIINERNGSLPSECQYPYKQKQNKYECPPVTENCITGIQVTDYYCFEHVGQEGLMALVATHGAVVVAIAADKLHKKYKGGIFDECSDKGEVNHAITIVGYGVSNKKKYWRAKNSLGENWGEDGYFRVERGNNCIRIEESALVPILTRTNNTEQLIDCTSACETRVRISCPILILILIVLIMIILIILIIMACVFLPKNCAKREYNSLRRRISNDPHPN